MRFPQGVATGDGKPRDARCDSLSSLDYGTNEMNRRISVIGLGYVGLPVATAFARSGAPVVAFDIDGRRIAAVLDRLAL